MSIERFLAIVIPQGKLFGQLSLPESARTLIIVPHGGDPHGVEAHVVPALLANGHGVLNIDLLTHQEHGGEILHNIHALVPRILRLLDFIRDDIDTGSLTLGIFAAGHVVAAALRVAAERDLTVRAVVLADGLIDRAGRQHLQMLAAPLLVLLRADDAELRAATERAFAYLEAPHELRSGDAVSFARDSCEWFSRQLPRPGLAGS